LLQEFGDADAAGEEVFRAAGLEEAEFLHGFPVLLDAVTYGTKAELDFLHLRSWGDRKERGAQGL